MRRSSGSLEVWEPEVEAQRLALIDHVFTHFHLRLNPIRVRCVHPAEGVKEGDRLLY